MESGFRFKASHTALSTQDIAALRPLCPLSIAELRRRASCGESMLDIPVVSGDWPAEETRLAVLVAGVADGSLPLVIFGFESGHEEALSGAQALQRLDLLRHIAHQQDVQTQLELGHIASPAQYKP